MGGLGIRIPVAARRFYRSVPKAMAQDVDASSKISDIASRTGRAESRAQKCRASLIRERVIEIAGYWLVRCAVPHLCEHIREDVPWQDWRRGI